MKIAHPSTAPQHRTSPREGKLDNRELMTGKEGEARNYRLALGLAETDVSVGKSAGPDLLFITKGTIKCGDTKCPLHSAIEFDALDGSFSIQALEPTEIFRMQLEA